MIRTRNRSLRSLSLLFGALTLAPALSAQSLLVQVPNAGGIGPAFDVDADGFGDFVVGRRIYSGADQSILFDAQSVVVNQFAGLAVVEDWNGDGMPDIVVGDTMSNFSGELRVLSSATKQQYDSIFPGFGDGIGIWRPVGDVDGDGLGDVYLAGAPPFGDMSVKVESTNGTLFFDLAYWLADYAWANGLGDLDLDGKDEWGSIRFFGTYCQLEIKGAALPSLTVDCTSTRLASVGDLDGDGRDDVLLSRGDLGSTDVLSGADLTTVLLTIPESYSSITGPGDVNCDGVPDLLLAQPNHGSSAGRVELRSGVDGSLLWFDEGDPGDSLGLDVSSAGDLNADGSPDWMVRSSSYVRVYVGPVVDATSYCTGKTTSAGCTPAVDTAGVPSLGGSSEFVVLARNTLAQKPGLFFFGTTGSIGVPFLGGTLCVAPPLVRTSVLLSSAGADCSTGYAFTFDPALATAQGVTAGDRVNGQFWMRDPGQADGTGVALSNGIEFIWCP